MDRINSRHAEIARELVSQPDRPDLRWEAGKLLVEQGLKQQGAAWIMTALQSDPAHRPSHEALSEYYAELGNSRLAEHHRRLARQAN